MDGDTDMSIQIIPPHALTSPAFPKAEEAGNSDNLMLWISVKTPISDIKHVCINPSL